MAQLFVMGGVRLAGPVGSIADADLPGPQGRLAFAALAVERRALTRDALAEIVWDGDVPPKWDGALSTIISKLRSLVSSTGLDGREIVNSLSGTYSLVLPPSTWVDLEDAVRRLDRAEGALRHGDAVAATADGTVASSILRRPFLAGIEGHWVDAQRRRIDDAAYRCSVTLARGWLERNDFGLAATVAETAVGLDPLRELGHRLLIEAELARGDRAAAQRAYLRCAELFRVELGVEPSAETSALVGRTAD